MTQARVKTRFAPSPTGLLHLGNLRTALFNALFARRHQGVFLLRLEDTDRERSRESFADRLMQDLRWLGLDWQEGPGTDGSGGQYRQSQRGEIYAEYYARLEQLDLVYPCFCSPEELALSRKLQRAAGQAPRYAGTCAHLSPEERRARREQGRQPSLRFRVPRGGQVEFDDLARGAQRFASDEIGDFIIRRADGSPAFFFCNALDDALMGVTHVLRGEDHLTNTPRQLMLLRALELPAPRYGHISLIVGDDGSPLSKRHGSRDLEALREAGWLPAGLLNYLARLGHAYAEEQGFMSLEQLAAGFELDRLGRAPARFDSRQMLHWQQAAMSRLDLEALWRALSPEIQSLVPDTRREHFLDAVRLNLSFPREAETWARLLFDDQDFAYSETAREALDAADAEFFRQAAATLDSTGLDWKAWTGQLKQDTGRKGKALFMPLRAALTGLTHGPEMARLLPLLGLERARQRLALAARPR